VDQELWWASRREIAVGSTRRWNLHRLACGASLEAGDGDQVMPTLRARNAELLVTMDDARRELRNAGLYAEDGIIRRVGPNAEPPATADTVIDPDAGLHRHHPAHRADRPLHILLSCVPEVVPSDRWRFVSTFMQIRHIARALT
jgi:hypothetical protein